MGDKAPDDYGLLVPFLDRSDSFAHGVEFGMIWERMKACREAGEPFADYVTTANQEQLTLAANRLGWTVEEMRQEADWGEHWVYVVLVPTGEATS
jgi:hypothetical protein